MGVREDAPGETSAWTCQVISARSVYKRTPTILESIGLLHAEPTAHRIKARNGSRVVFFTQKL